MGREDQKIYIISKERSEGTKKASSFHQVPIEKPTTESPKHLTESPFSWLSPQFSVGEIPIASEISVPVSEKNHSCDLNLMFAG